MSPGHRRYQLIHARVIIGESAWEAMWKADDDAATMFSDIAAPLRSDGTLPSRLMTEPDLTIIRSGAHMGLDEREVG